MTTKRPPSRPRKGQVFVPKPAPGDLAIVQSFVNTRNRRSRIDRLTSVDELAAWLGRWSLAAAPEKPSEADLKRARDLREGLQALLLANSGYPLDAAAVQRLDLAQLGGADGSSARLPAVHFKPGSEGLALKGCLWRPHRYCWD